MITIHKPYIEVVGDLTFLKARIVDESAGTDSVLFYSVDNGLGRYLCDEVADSFLVAMLVPAAASRQDIRVEAPLSEKLYFSVCNYVCCMLDNAWGYRVSVVAEELADIDFHPEAVGTGCSLGVDSLSAIFQLLENAPSDSYRLTHLTYLNIGGYGSKDMDQAESVCRSNLESVKSFAAETGLDVVYVSSNVTLFYGAAPALTSSITFRNASAVLAMQKFYRRYFIASSLALRYLEFRKSVEYYDIALLPYLSTSNTEFLLAGTDIDRSDKIAAIVDNPLTKRYLTVCWKDLIRNNQLDVWGTLGTLEGENQNCTRCEKCLRTLLCIDILGRTDEYAGIFDVPYFRRVRTLLIAKVIALRKENEDYSDLLAAARKYGYRIPPLSRFLSLFYHWYGLLFPIKRLILRKLNH